MSTAAHALHEAHSLAHHVQFLVEVLGWTWFKFLVTLFLVGGGSALMLYVLLVLLRRRATPEHWCRFVLFVGWFGVLAFSVWAALLSVGLSFSQISAIGVVSLVLSYGLADAVANYAAAVAIAWHGRVDVGKYVHTLHAKGRVVEMTTQYAVLLDEAKNPDFVSGRVHADEVPELDYVPNTDIVRYGFTVPRHHTGDARLHRAAAAAAADPPWMAAAAAVPPPPPPRQAPPKPPPPPPPQQTAAAPAARQRTLAPPTRNSALADQGSMAAAVKRV